MQRMSQPERELAATTDRVRIPPQFSRLLGISERQQLTSNGADTINVSVVLSAGQQLERFRFQCRAQGNCQLPPGEGMQVDYQQPAALHAIHNMLFG